MSGNGSLQVVEDPVVKDGTQVWLDSNGYVLDITTNERARFYAMFGLMQVPAREAKKVLLSPADYADLIANIPDAVPGTSHG